MLGCDLEIYVFSRQVNLILHIGTEKTGSTSIQQFLKKNLQQLKSDGNFVPQTPMVGSGNHRWIPVFAGNNRTDDVFTRSLNLRNNEERKKVILNKRRQFVDECRNAAKTCKSLILSSEHIQSQLRTIQEIQRLRDLVDEVADDVCIIIYVRDPLKMAVSLLSESIKGGGVQVGIHPPDFKRLEHICNHAQTIQRWQECFPKAKIIVRRFDRSCLEKGDAVIDFCSQVIDNFHEDKYEFDKPANETLSLTGMALLRNLNVQFPMFVGNKPNLMRGKIHDFVMKNTRDGSKFLPCKEEFDAFKSHFSESCERVRSDYFPLEESLFIEQTEFAEAKIDLSKVVIDPHILEQLVELLWRRNRKLELRLKNTV